MLEYQTRSFTKKYGKLVFELDTPIKIANPAHRKFFKLSGIWDTGATNSVITKSAAQKCGLIPVGMENLSGVTGSLLVPAYFITVELPNDIEMNLRVIEGEDCIGCDILVGMDIISKGDFCVTNKDDNTIFTFRVPSMDSTDYTKAS